MVRFLAKSVLRLLSALSNIIYMVDSLFTKIIKKEIPAKIVYENEQVVAFADIHPQAPVHILIVPRKQIENVGAAVKDDQSILGALLLAAGEIARAQGVDDSGYRLVINKGADAGESVPHLHVHLLGGRELRWPPG